MSRYTKTIDIWTLTEEERSLLPIGQWVTAGPDGPKGRFMGQGRATTVVAWLENGRGRWRSYMKTIRNYARSVTA